MISKIYSKFIETYIALDNCKMQKELEQLKQLAEAQRSFIIALKEQNTILMEMKNHRV